MMAPTAPIRFFEAMLVAYRRTWRGTVISSFVNPVLFLAAMGLGGQADRAERLAAVVDDAGLHGGAADIETDKERSGHGEVLIPCQDGSGLHRRGAEAQRERERDRIPSQGRVFAQALSR